MKLQQKIARGMLGILVVLIIIIVLTHKSYSDTEGFIVRDLPRNFRIAREYEKLAEYWSKNGEAMKDYVKFGINDRISLGEVFDTLEKYVSNIGLLASETDERKFADTIREKNVQYSSFVRTIDSLVDKRNKLQTRFIERREKAAENARTEIFSLLDQFKSMMQSWLEFKSTLTDASDLLNQITRIERDLQAVQSEMSTYLSISNTQEPSIEENGENQNRKTRGSASASRVERRLRTVLLLVKQAVSESRLPVHKRVLSQIESKIKIFYDGFIKLRNVLEVPEVDLIETEDNLNKLLERATKLRQEVVLLAHSRSQLYWEKIFSVSEKLINSAKNNYRIMFTFLGLIFMASLYLVYEFPRSVSRPLENLNKSVNEFQLGKTEQPEIASDVTEITELGKAFGSMVRRLNVQGEINRKYLESIHSLTNIYRDLHETTDRVEYPFERISNAISLVLQQLIEQTPKIDLVKAMVVYKDPENGKEYFVRLGNPFFSENFKNSEEADVYFKSTGYNLKEPEKSEVEFIPVGKGITGYYYEQFSDIVLGSENGSDFFVESYPLQPIPQNFSGYESKYETGLKGSLLTERLKVPDKDPDVVKNARGLLFVYFMGDNVKLSWQEIFFIQIIASQIASIIETDGLLLEHDQKKLIDDQLKMAKEIQENLLPRNVPIIPGLSVSKINVPAAEVGGDYYDFFDLGDGKLRLVIADASGKNVPAAIVMTVFKTTLSTMDLKNMTAADVLIRANNIIEKNITSDRFITAMYAIIDSKTGEVELASAGHNPAFVVPAKGDSIDTKSVKGMPLGILEDYPYQSIEFKMNDGDILWMYTDGVTEARNIDEEEFGEKKLKRFIVNYKGKDPAGDLLEEVKEFSKMARQHDDITAVTVSFSAKA